MVPAFFFGITLVLAQLTSARGDSSIGVLDFALIATAVLAASVTVLGARPARPPHHGASVSRGGAMDFAAAFSDPLVLYAFLSALVITISYVLNAQRPAASLESLGSASVPFYAGSVLILCMVIVLYSQHGRAMICGFITASLALSAVYVFGFVTQTSAMLYFDVRFKGFAENPNQTALLALGTILVLVVSLLRFDRSDRTIRMMIFITIPLTLIYGAATRSDAFVLALPVLLSFIGILALDRLKIKRWVAILIGITLGAISILLFAIIAPGLFGVLGVAIQDQLETGSQDTDRQLLWLHGFRAFLDSPWIGNGPGAWSGLGGPYQGTEAHNSIIDWLSITGLVGLAPVLIVVSRFFRSRLRFKLLRNTGFLALIIFAAFHFTFRLPIFWFALAMLSLPFFSWADGPEDDGSHIAGPAPGSRR